MPTPERGLGPQVRGVETNHARAFDRPAGSPPLVAPDVPAEPRTDVGMGRRGFFSEGIKNLKNVRDSLLHVNQRQTFPGAPRIPVPTGPGVPTRPDRPISPPTPRVPLGERRMSRRTLLEWGVRGAKVTGTAVVAEGVNEVLGDPLRLNLNWWKNAINFFTGGDQKQVLPPPNPSVAPATATPTRTPEITATPTTEPTPSASAEPSASPSPTD